MFLIETGDKCELWYRPCDGELPTGSASSADVRRSHDRPYRERESNTTYMMTVITVAKAFAVTMVSLCNYVSAGGGLILSV